jgi:hypothetical protein
MYTILGTSALVHLLKCYVNNTRFEEFPFNEDNKIL